MNMDFGAPKYQFVVKMQFIEIKTIIEIKTLKILLKSYILKPNYDRNLYEHDEQNYENFLKRQSQFDELWLYFFFLIILIIYNRHFVTFEILCTDIFSLFWVENRSLIIDMHVISNYVAV